MENDRIKLHIVTKGQDFYIQLENLSGETLTNIKLETIRIKNYDRGPERKIEFETLPELPAKRKSEIKHHVFSAYKKGKWTIAEGEDASTNNMLMCLTDEFSRNADYQLRASWSINGKPGHQTIRAGAGSGLIETPV